MKLVVNIGFIFLISLIGVLTRVGMFHTEKASLSPSLTVSQDLTDHQSNISVLLGGIDRQGLLYVESLEEDEDKTVKKGCPPILKVAVHSRETRRKDVSYLNKRLIPAQKYTPKHSSCLYLLHEVFRL